MKPFLFCLILASTAYPATKKTDPPPQVTPGSRTVQVSDRDIIPIATRLRFTTMIVLPKEESILDFVCGDKEFWVVNGAQNFAFIKPAREGGQTNLNLITASGNVYSFTLTEGEGSPDLKVFVEPKGAGLLAAINGQPRFVPSQAIDDYRRQVELAGEAAQRAKDDAAAQITAAQRESLQTIERERQAFPTQMRFDYRYRDQPDFNVAAIYRDDRFTYIRADPQETPALYEIKDGKPSLIQFRFEGGLYTVPKILDRGYLAIGKKKLHFTREAER
jgi:type IV secretion system protein VirB9